MLRLPNVYPTEVRGVTRHNYSLTIEQKQLKLLL